MTQDLEKAALQGHVDALRADLLALVALLPAAAWRMPIPPSGWTCLDLVHHLAVDVERHWFRGVVAGQPDVVSAQSGRGHGWSVDPSLTPGSALALYRDEIRRADQVIESGTLDAAVAWIPADERRTAPQTLREVLVTVALEMAAHCGQVEAALELALPCEARTTTAKRAVPNPAV